MMTILSLRETSAFRDDCVIYQHVIFNQFLFQKADLVVLADGKGIDRRNDGNSRQRKQSDGDQTIMLRFHETEDHSGYRREDAEQDDIIAAVRDAHLPDFQEGSDGLEDDNRNQDLRENLAEQVSKFILEIAGKDIDDDDDDRIGNKQSVPTDCLSRIPLGYS